jgi:hypothetical protein
MYRDPLNFVMILILILTSLSLFSQEVDATSISNVVITYPYGEYEIGSEVDVTVHVFNYGQYCDAQEVLLIVGEGDREIGTTRQGPGMFTGMMVIEEKDISPIYQVEVSSNVRTGDVWETPMGVTRIETVYRRAFEIETVLPEFINHWPVQGETVHYDVYFTFMDEPVDPDPGTLDVDLSPRSWAYGDLSRISTGHYNGSFRVPEGLTESVTSSLLVEGEYTWGNFTFKRNIWVSFFVDMIHVWCQKERADTTGTTLNLYVYDDDMGAIGGAEVELSYTLNTLVDGVYEDFSDTMEGITDSHGTVTFELEYPRIDPLQPWVRINGHVLGESLRQDFTTSIHIMENPTVRRSGDPSLELMILNELPLPVESNENLMLVLKSDHDPVSGTDVGYTVSTDQQVVASGTATTDNDGQFEVPVVTPGIGSKLGYGSLMEMRIFVERDGQIEHVDLTITCQHNLSGFLEWYDDQTMIELEQSAPGANISVNIVDSQTDDSGDAAWLAWGLGPIEWDAYYLPLDKNWTKVSPGTMFGAMMVVPGTSSEGRYTADINIPDFIPEGSELYVVGVIEFQDSGKVIRRMAFIDGFPIETEIDDVEGPEKVEEPEWLIWIVILLFVVVLTSLLIWKSV